MIWQAHRKGDKILCGRQVAGRDVCQGEIATVELVRYVSEPSEPRRPTVMLPPGLTEDPPGFWRRSARADDQRNRGEVPDGHGGHRVNDSGHNPKIFPQLPFRRCCPHCNVVGEVTTAVLVSNDY